MTVHTTSPDVTGADGVRPGAAQTVLGPVAPESLGIVLSHDHLLCYQPDIGAYGDQADPASDTERWEAPLTIENIGWIRLNWLSNRANIRLDEEDVALAELQRFGDAGGGTVVDPTVDGLGRDPEALVRLARATGVHILMGCGFYVAPTHPDDMDERSLDDLTATIVSDLVDGVGDSGIRAGFIGEVGCTWPLQDAERRVLAASVAAQNETGAPLMIHPGRHPDAPFEILSVIESAGGDAKRTVMGHVDRTVPSTAGLRRLAETGCYLSFDVFGLETSMYPFYSTGLDVPSDAQRIGRIEDLVAAGFSDQIVVSHDICTKHRLGVYGGHGYDYLVRYIAPWMRRRGASAEVIQQIFETNPQRAFTMQPAR